ncbi:hypothetical protein Holit_02242 [Hollandina sp. SP2]
MEILRKILFWVCFCIVASSLYLTATFNIFVMVYVFTCIFMAARALFFIKLEINKKLTLIVSYIIIMILQLTYNTLIIHGEDINSFVQTISRIFGVIFIVMPFFVEFGFEYKNFSNVYLPSVQNIEVFSFNEVKEYAEDVLNSIYKLNKKLSKDNVLEIMRDIPRHSSFRYINDGSLSEEYFHAAYETLNDPWIYIIISNTGSAASEIISIFTQKQYNHASLSFDKELKTIVSYNGGNKIYPPGMNQEMIEYFNKKEDASIIVYRLKVTSEKKKTIIDKIKEINTEGNAYNLLGLITKQTFKPNIMFCSQFVYKMLKYVGLQYFEKKNENVSPIDLVELDYYRKLEYEYEIKLNNKCKGEHCA